MLIIPTLNSRHLLTINLLAADTAHAQLDIGEASLHLRGHRTVSQPPKRVEKMSVLGNGIQEKILTINKDIKANDQIFNGKFFQ